VVLQVDILTGHRTAVDVITDHGSTADILTGKDVDTAQGTAVKIEDSKIVQPVVLKETDTEI
jgi:hypothetical protein